MENNKVLDASLVRMRDHLGTITRRYVEICQWAAETCDSVDEDLELDQLMRTGEYEGVPITPNFGYFGLQCKNLGYAMKSVSQQMHYHAEALQNATSFEMEPSMHTGRDQTKFSDQRFFLEFLLFFYEFLNFSLKKISTFLFRSLQACEKGRICSSTNSNESFSNNIKYC